MRQELFLLVEDDSGSHNLRRGAVGSTELEPYPPIDRGEKVVPLVNGNTETAGNRFLIWTGLLVVRAGQLLSVKQTGDQEQYQSSLEHRRSLSGDAASIPWRHLNA